MRSILRTGDKIMVSGGILGCCCGVACTDGDPLTVDVVFSGQTDCGCLALSGSLSAVINSFDLSGPYTLTWNAVPGAWQLAGAGSMNVSYFSSGDCSGAPFLTQDEVFNLQAQCVGDDFDANAQAVFNPSGTDILWSAFSGQGLGNVAISNTLACGANVAFSGGTATISV